MIHDGRLQIANQESLSSGWASTVLTVYAGVAVQAKQLANLYPYNTGDFPGDHSHLVIQFDTVPSGGGVTTVGAALVSATTAGATDLLLGTHLTHWSSFDLTTLGYPVSLITAGNPVWIVPLPKKPSYLNFVGLVLYANAAPTGGAVSAFITNDPNNWLAYRDASN